MYIATALFIAGCSKDSGEEIIQVKDLVPASVVVKQGDMVVENLLINGKITLEQGKNYTVWVTFSEDVELQKGEFLKMYAKNSKEYYAEFYGRNLNEISEKVVFKKEGYNDYSLEIAQSAMVVDFYTTVANSESYPSSYVEADNDNKTVWITNLRDTQAAYTSKMNMIFIAPVFLEDVTNESGETVVKVKAIDDSGEKFYLEVINQTITQNFDEVIVLPIYANVNGEKGAKQGEIIFRGNPKPYASSTINYVTYYTGWGLYPSTLNFYVQSSKVYVYLDNINTDVVKKYEANVEQGKVTITEVSAPTIKGMTRIFDAYEGELVNGEVVKKGNAQKREIFINVR